MSKKGTTKYMSDKQEKSVAKDIEGRPVIASGSLWGSKGDARSTKYLVECKTTSKNHYSVDIRIVWEKIRKEAVKDGLRLPLLCIDLCDGKYRYAVMSRGDYEGRLVSRITGKSCKTILGNSFSVYAHDGTITRKVNNKYTVTKEFLIMPWDKFLLYEGGD